MQCTAIAVLRPSASQRPLNCLPQSGAHWRAHPITQRLEMVNSRSRFGYEKANFLLGRQDCQGAFLAVKERTSSLTLLVNLTARDSTTVRRDLARVLKRYSAHLHSLTTDTAVSSHSLWQRGQVEGENKNIH